MSKETGPPAATTAPSERFTLSGSLDLARVIDTVAARLDVRVDYDPAVVTGKVTVRGEAGSAAQLWELMHALLASRGLTTVRASDDAGFTVVRVAQAAQQARARLIDVSPSPPPPPPPEVHPPPEGAAAPPAQVPAEPAVPPLGGVKPDVQPPTPTFQLEPGFKAEILRVRHRPARELAEALKPILSKDGAAAQAIGESDLLLIADLTARVEDAKRLLVLLDVPTAGLRVVETPLRFLPPAQLITLATQVNATREAAEKGSKLPGQLLPGPTGADVLIVTTAAYLSAWQELITALDRREPLETRTYTPRYYGVKEITPLIEQAIAPAGPDRAAAGWKLLSEELTGALIITATASQHEQVRQLLARVDAAPEGVNRPVRAFAIRNRPVGELLQTLRALIEGGGLEAQLDVSSSLRAAGAQQTPIPTPPGSTPTPPGTTSTPTPAGLTPAGATPSTINSAGTNSGGVTPSFGNNALSTAPSGTGPLAPASVRGARGIGALNGGGSSGGVGAGAGAGVGVTLTADEGTNTLIAIAEPRMLAQLEGLIALLDVRQPQVRVEVFLVSLSDAETLQLGVELEKLDTIGDARVQLASLFGLSTAAGGVRTPGTGAGFTGAVLSPGEFNIVVRALETINQGSSRSLPSVLVNNNQEANFTSVLQQPFSTTNASSSNVTTTTFGGTQDAGTTIAIRPQIAEGDHLVLEYSLSLSSFVGDPSAAGLPPPRQQNNVSSKATIPDGYTVAVGGLELTTQSEGVTQVPLLGDIPLLGELFKNRSLGATRTRFFVFIRANVLRDPGLNDLKYLSGEARRGLPLKDGWPQLAPRVIR